MILFSKMWPWLSMTLGIIVIVLAYIDAVQTGVWFDDHGLPDDLSSVPQIALGLVGIGLIIGGLLAGLTSIRRPTTRP